MKFMSGHQRQGFHLFTDNFYTSVKPYSDLFAKGVYCCGTVTENRKGFPGSMKAGKAWFKSKNRGDMRWERTRPCLALQWKDNKVVTMLSTIHNAIDFVMLQWKEKHKGKWESIHVRQPKVILEYNHCINGVDRSDQIPSNHNLLRKCVCWRETLLSHLIDIATVNSSSFFTNCKNENPT